MPSVEINWVALVAAAIINVMVGQVWYARLIPGKERQRLFGNHKVNSGGRSYLVAAVGAFLQAFILVHFVRYAGALTLWRGAQVGFWLWMWALLCLVMASSIAFRSSENRIWRLWQISAGYFLVVLLIDGALLAAWR